MTRRQKWIRRSAFTVMGVVISFFVIAGVGLWREKHDEKVMRHRYQEYGEFLRQRIDSIGEGVPIEQFKKSLPFAFYDEEAGEYRVSIPTRFSDTPSTINSGYVTKYFTINNGIVSLDEYRSGVGMSHGDRFVGHGLGRLIYYFQRAWRSHIDPDWPPDW
jgi:hypothetical protein